MAILKPFKALRPRPEYVAEVASRPYDVLNTLEAKAEAEGNPLSFLHVVKPEIDFPDDHDPYSPDVYEKGKENFRQLVNKGIFKQDSTECLYVYMLEMNGKKQTGIVGCAAVDDYFTGIIKKHELTRPDKEEDRKNHVRISRMHAEPVFFAYPYNKSIDDIVETVKKGKPEYDFRASDGIKHLLWVISDPLLIKKLSSGFQKIPYTYIADGHHRTAAAALVGKEFREKNRDHNGAGEYDYFMAVHFPDNQLQIFDYNRVIKDLNGHSREEFLELLSSSFDIRSNGPAAYKPGKLHEFAMYLEGNWFILNALPGRWNEDDPMDVLDVSILFKQVLKPVLGIEDIRKDKRIDFVGGIRGLGELEKRVNSTEMKVAFALFPVSMKQLMDIADSGMIMPPKTTWFEPKLRSGLFVHGF
jgi:uncharacterized protein (DUF1015 family)